MWSMNKHRLYKTSPHPKHQPFKLITDGLINIQEPLYFGMFIMIFGFGLASDIYLYLFHSFTNHNSFIVFYQKKNF